MNTTPSRTSSDMDQLLEPLAGYLCATGYPKSALKLVMAALYNKIEQTNAEAREHVASLRDRRPAVSA